MEFGKAVLVGFTPFENHSGTIIHAGLSKHRLSFFGSLLGLVQPVEKTFLLQFGDDGVVDDIVDLHR
jgi:hypothetical protein